MNQTQITTQGPKFNISHTKHPSKILVWKAVSHWAILKTVITIHKNNFSIRIIKFIVHTTTSNRTPINQINNSPFGSSETLMKKVEIFWNFILWIKLKWVLQNSQSFFLFFPFRFHQFPGYQTETRENQKENSRGRRRAE